MFQRNPLGVQHYDKTGRGQQTSTVPWVSSDFEDAGTSAVGHMLLTPWYDDFGNVFILKRVRGSALTIGMITEWNAPGTDTVSSATTQVITLTTGGLTAGAEVGWDTVPHWVWDAVLAVSGSPLTDSLKPIKANTVTTLTVSKTDPAYGNYQPDPDAYATAPAGADALTIIRPEEVKKYATADAAFAPCTGVAMGAVVQDDFAFLQIGGLGLCRTVVSPAFTPNKPVVPSAATAGSVISNATPVAGGNQVGVAACTYNVASVALAPVWLQLAPTA